MWGMAIQPPKNAQQYKDILLQKKKMSLEEAVFRSEKAFRPANLQEYSSFWEDEILKDHPHKQNLLKWIKGVDIDDFLNSFTDSEFQGARIHSHFPQNKEFSNYVPEEFEQFMDDTVTEWEQMGVLLEWEKVRKEGDPLIPVVVSPLGVEPTKPRALWDGRYVNEFCRDIPFSMDNASKVAEVAWGGVYFFKLDHKNGYLHVPIEEGSRKYFGVFWKGKYYVFAVLPFGWKSSPLIYHSLTEALAMYIRSLGIPMLVWIDDMLGMTEQKFQGAPDEDQFQSALRAMVVTTMILFLAGYFLGIPKCCLLPEQVMTYLGIDCDSLHSRFLVPEKRVTKYLPMLRDMLSRPFVSYLELESLVGKLASLECAVDAGMWYTRHQYAALASSGANSMSKRRVKLLTKIFASNKIKEEWYMWAYFLENNGGSPWKSFQNIYVKASVHSDASGRAYAGMVNIPNGPCSVTAGEFTDKMLSQDIQVKEGEALRATISMIVSEMPSLVQGKTLVCHIDNQALKAVYERKGTSHNLALTDIGKKIYWLQRAGGFSVKLEYVQSEKNVSDPYTRGSPGLETSLSHSYFLHVWDTFGPFEWDIMASAANVNTDHNGNPLPYFSRYFEESSKGVNVFSQDLTKLQNMFCFPPIPMIAKLLKHLQQQKVSCVLIVPKIWAPWSNLLRAHSLAELDLAKPFDSNAFSITHPSGKRVPKKFPFSMQAVFMDFTV